MTENLMSRSDPPPHYHTSVVYDNLPQDKFESINAWVSKQCLAFQDKVANYLAKYDLDMNPNPKKEGGGKIALGVFTYAPELEE